jgi:hypothetical protein
VGLDVAIESYLAEGAPAPERPEDTSDDGDPLGALDVEADDLPYEGPPS